MRRPSTSSRLKPKVIWVRSFVPKLKKSASSASSPATRAARGVSTIVPIVTFSRRRSAAGTVSAIARSTQARGEGELGARDRERDHDLDDGTAPASERARRPPP